jgi:D-alanyl-D-alanine carboxypeptidase
VARNFLSLSTILLLLLFALPAEAARKKNQNRNFDFTNSERYAGLVVNAENGEIVYHRNADKELYPASLTKMMTIYMAFQAIDDGKLSFDQKLPISLKAASQPKTNLRLRAGDTMTVREAILGLIVHSANDASVVLAEAIAGSEDAFADRMTRVAHSLGMSKTTFKNSHGLPNSEQVTTAFDLAKLAIALRRDYNHYYPMFSTRSFKFRGSIINSHNRVMYRYPWADGLKTGFIHASGFNLVTSANRHDTRLVGVVMGGHTASARDNHMIQLLEYGYENLQKTKYAKGNNPILEVAGKHSNYNLPYKEGAFEVAFNNDDDLPPEEVTNTVENDEVLGDLVDKGLRTSVSSTPKKLGVKPLPAVKNKQQRKEKITVVAHKKKDKLMKTDKYNKVIVLKKSSKNNQAAPRADKSKQNKEKTASHKGKAKNHKMLT